MEEILDLIIKASISIGVTTIASLASVLLKKLINKFQDTKIMSYVRELVEAAEQLYPNTGMKTGSQKYKYVVEQLLDKYPTLKDKEYIQTIIEASVYSLSHTKEDLVKEIVGEVEDSEPDCDEEEISVDDIEDEEVANQVRIIQQTAQINAKKFSSF